MATSTMCAVLPKTKSEVAAQELLLLDLKLKV